MGRGGCFWIAAGRAGWQNNSTRRGRAGQPCRCRVGLGFGTMARRHEQDIVVGPVHRSAGFLCVLLAYPYTLRTC